MYFKSLIVLFSRITMLMITILLMTFCSIKSTNTSGISESNKEKIALKTSDKAVIEQPNIYYNYDTLYSIDEVKHFKETYSPKQIKVIAAINRIDPHRIKTGTVLIIPNPLLDSISPYMPFPTTLEALAKYPKSILVNQRIQAFAAYENGRQIRTAPISSGKKSTPTPNGLYHTNYKAKRKVSTINGNWVMPWYFNIDNNLGIALHKYDLPGYPASHSCIRLYEDDAQWFYNWGEQWKLSKNRTLVVEKGTPVLIFGNYNFDSIPPWMLLPQNNMAVNLTAEELKIISESFL